MKKKSFYTILMRKGNPVLYVCPTCGNKAVEISAIAYRIENNG